MKSDFDEIREILNQLALAQLKTDAALDRLTANQDRTDAQLAKTDAQLSKTDAQLAKTIKKLDAIGVQMGDLGHSNGEHAEAMFYEALAGEKTLGGIKYDSIEKNRKKRRDRTEDEFDIFLENGSSVGIVEVKYKVQKAHIDKILNQKQKNFRIIFPEMKDYKLYMGIAGFSFEPESEEYAMDNGLVVLKQKGKVVQVNASQMRAF